MNWQFLSYKQIMLICVFLSSVGLSFTDDLINPALSTPLVSAHQAYLNGDFKTLGGKLKQVLEQPGLDGYSFQNVMELLDKTQDLLGNRPMPVDWKLPNEVYKLMLLTRRTSTAMGTEYMVELSGVCSDVGLIRELSIWQPGLKPLLSLRSGLCEWAERAVYLPGKKASSFRLCKKGEERIPEGLYLLEVLLDNGHQTKGWFILTGAGKPAGPMSIPFEASVSEQTANDESRQLPITDDAKSQMQIYRDALSKNILAMERQSRISRLHRKKVIRLNQYKLHLFGQLKVRQETNAEVVFE